MAPPIIKMLMPLGFALIAKSFIDSENTVHVFAVRLLYFLSQILCLGVIGYIYHTSWKRVEPGLVATKEDLGFGQEGDEVIKISIPEYDRLDCKKQFQKILVGSAITLFIHFKWGFFPPLFIQTIVHPISLYNSPLVKVTLRGFRAWGELKRPWRDNTSNFSEKFKDLNNTWQNAMNGTPAVKQNDKKSKKKIR